MDSKGSPIILQVIQYLLESWVMTGFTFRATGLYFFLVTTPRQVTIPSALTDVVEDVKGYIGRKLEVGVKMGLVCFL